MAWPNLFRQKDENTRDAWGYTFQWTTSHLTPEELHPLKFSYDVLGEECLNRLDEISPPPIPGELPRNHSRTPGAEKGPTVPKRDLFALIRDHALDDPKLMEMWSQVNTTPDWVDWDQVGRGQEVFYRYAGVALTALTYQSLLGGMGAARVTEVLARTGGFSTNVAKHRLYETTQHILEVTKSIDSIKPGGAGHQSSIRVRLLHAAVRRRIMKLAREKPSYYSVEEFGIPINDLDSIGTISTFSSTLIWLGFPRQGIYLRQQEIEDYLALWRLVAHYIGTPTEHFVTPDRARYMMESIFCSEINPSETSKILANNIILALQSQPPAYASKDFLTASARWLNGPALSDALGLSQVSYYHSTLVFGQCLFFCLICYTYRSIPYLDKKKIAALRRILYSVIVENKEHGLGKETSFEFKYVPNFDTKTELGTYKEGLRERGVERRNLVMVMLATAIVGGMSFVGMKSAWALVGTARGLLR